MQSDGNLVKSQRAGVFVKLLLQCPLTKTETSVVKPLPVGR